MTYNGIGMVSTKGTGLSGYVQRSRVTVHQGIRVSALDKEAVAVQDGLTPLERVRSVKENAELAAFLADHDRRRAIRLQVETYRERRTKELGNSEAASAAEIVASECNSMRESLLAHYEAEREEAQRAARAAAARDASRRKAESFAAAVGVKSGAEPGAAFQRAQKLEAKATREVSRREAVEQELIERVKKARLE